MGKNLTAYGGLLPVAAMLEKLEFQQLVGESVNLDRKRMPRAREPSGFLLGMILAVYVGFSRLNHLQYLEREPMLLGILRVAPTIDANGAKHRMVELCAATADDGRWSGFLPGSNTSAGWSPAGNIMPKTSSALFGSAALNPNYAQQAQPDRYALWQQRIRHRHPVIVQVI